MARVTVGIPTRNRSGWLGEAIESVLAQSFTDFRLLISDNASDDDTAEVVASYPDPRVDYRRVQDNIGMLNNFNRLIELTDTDLLVLLPDDDLFYPGYLAAAVDALDRHPSAGVAHSGFDVIDPTGAVLEHGKVLAGKVGRVTLEKGERFLARSMKNAWVICWPSALFRTRAIAEAHGLRSQDEPTSDLPLFMRIALRWDFVSIPETLVATRVHAGASSATNGSFTGSGYDAGDAYAEMIFGQRERFLAEAALPPEVDRRYRALAVRSLRQDSIGRLAHRAGAGAGDSALRQLIRFALADPRCLLLAGTWRLVAAELGARRVRRLLVRLRRR